MQNNVKAQRAKLFLSFDALKGFRDYIKLKQKKIVPKKDLFPDALDELDWKIKQIIPGQMVTFVYYHQHEYISLQGMVAKIDLAQRKIQIVEKVIDFQDIVQIEL